MRLLAVDIGNTNIKCGIIEDGRIVESWRYETAKAADIGGDLDKRAGNLPFALCSVVPKATTALEASFRQADLKITTQLETGLRGFYPTFGADRLADAVAAKTLYSKDKNLLVLGLGTATVLTAFSAQGDYQGGLITLGLTSTAQTLSSRIPQLPPISLDNLENVDLALETTASMRSGTILAHLGAIERWVNYAIERMGGPTITVASGGWAESMASQTKAIDYSDPLLTLKGTYFIAETALREKAAT